MNPPFLTTPSSPTHAGPGSRTLHLTPCRAALAAMLFAPVLANASGTTTETVLGTIEVKGQAMSGARAGYTSTRLDEDEIRERKISQVQELYRQVPGMAIRNLGLTGVADSIVLRGFGGGGHGGDIGFSVDGIPLNEAMSHADGYADLNVIVPLELRALTVQKGPVSPLYGNFNRAGTVTLETRKGGEYRELDLSAGSFGTLDAQAAAGLRLSNTQQLNLAAQLTRSDGFRTQSGSWRGTLAGRWSVDLADDLRLALSGRAHRARADNPGYLSRTSFRTDPYGKEPGVQNDGADKEFGTVRADLQYTANADLKLLAFTYATSQEFSRWFTRPVSGVQRQREESYDRSVQGAGFSLNGRHGDSTPVSWVAGVETFRERTDYEFYDGLDRRRRVNPATNDRRSELRSLSAFAEAEMALHALFKPTAGVRWDRFNGNCRLNGPEISTAACERMARISHTSPKLGFRSQVADGVELRASRAEGFALASDFAKYSLGAADLDPNVFRQTELGARITAVPDLAFDLAVWRLISSDEIRTVSPGVFENFGSTRRNGVEIEAMWSAHVDLDFRLAWASTDSKVTKNANPALVGNRVAGVPRTTATLEASWRPVAGWQGTLTWQKVGRYHLDAANTLSYGGYDVFDLRVSYSAGTQLPYTVYAAIDNLTDRKYATSVSTIGYATGAPRTLRMGAQLSF